MTTKTVPQSAMYSIAQYIGLTGDQMTRLLGLFKLLEVTPVIATALERGEGGEAVYVIFDGPPSHESGRFVEVETEDGKSISVGKWENYSGEYWRLGPLYTAPTGGN